MNIQSEKWKLFDGGHVPSSLHISHLLFDYINKDSHILDLGCGEGRAIIELFEKGYDAITGTDINAQSLNNAVKRLKTHAPAGNLPQLAVSDAYSLPFRNECFDCVVTHAFWTTIIGAENRAAVACEIFRVLRNDGILYISDFARNDDKPLYRKRYEEGKAMGYEEGTFEAAGVSASQTYLAHHYTIEEIEDFTRVAGLKMQRWSLQVVTTRSGNKIDGHVAIALKPDAACSKCRSDK